MPAIGDVDLALSFAYSALLVLVLVLSYRGVWRRNSRD